MNQRERLKQLKAEYTAAKAFVKRVEDNPPPYSEALHRGVVRASIMVDEYAWLFGDAKQPLITTINFVDLLNQLPEEKKGGE